MNPTNVNLAMYSIIANRTSYDISSCFSHPQDDLPEKVDYDTYNTAYLSVSTTTNSRYLVQPECQSSPEGRSHEHVTLAEPHLANDKKFPISASKDDAEQNALPFTCKTPASYLCSPQVNRQAHKGTIPKLPIKDLKNSVVTSGPSLSFLTQVSSCPTQDVDSEVQEKMLASMGSKKKGRFESPEDLEADNLLTEGINTSGDSSSVDANGFIPQYKESPSYIKVCTRNKKQKEFKHIFLAQELSISGKIFNGLSSNPVAVENSSQSPHNTWEVSQSHGAIWALEFSLDGIYLAAAGRGQTVRVWAVLATPEERQAYECKEKSAEFCDDNHLNAHVFSAKPVRSYVGHTGDVLDINWSKNNFLLSSSLDKTVKLWHPSRPECLCTFRHDDLITSIKFHPTDDRFFLTGSLGRILGFWSIPEKKVVYSTESSDSITAVAFTPDGMTAISGDSCGLCQFYDIDQKNGLRFNDQIDVRSSRRKNSKGNKITGIKTAIFPPDHPYAGEVNILVTSNDSRVRLYRLKDKRIQMKFRGHQNTHSQINASFSDDGRFVICGSEDRKAYICAFPSRSIKPEDSDSKETPPAEFFCAHSSIVTAAILAPMATRKLLSRSGDPIYDICNPRPITLLSLNEYEIAQPTDFKNSNQSVMNPQKTHESPAYLTRTSHNDGPIILTSDITGSIKCFRIDCAFGKRRQWDISSTSSKKKSSIHCSCNFMTHISNSSRTNSIDHFSTTPSSKGSAYVRCVNIHNSCAKTTHGSPGNSFCQRKSSLENPHEKPNQLSVVFTPQTIVNNVIGNFSSVPFLNSTNTTGKKSLDTYSDLSDHTLTTESNIINNTKPNNMPQQYSLSGKSTLFQKMPTWCPLASSSNHERETGNSQRINLIENDRNYNVENETAEESSGALKEDQTSTSGFNGEQIFCNMCEGKEFRARRVQDKSLVMACVRCGVIYG